ncbi:MAG: glutathione S-transferase N-terminal domain-containing protein [Candidatus Marinimicrobia bacterium]|nr:glutathione S-transferase N-terminal domain-containing protein [Candidatus Neomarinimicrobiota bacterium]
MIELYETAYCPFCSMVKEQLEELKLEYTTIIVPSPLHQRQIVQDISGQSLVPVIVDGDEVINDSRRIIEYLSDKYSSSN